MGKQKNNSRPTEIDIKSRSKNEFFLIHGYTGSTTDFNKLPIKLHKTFKANVKAPLLRGHGTHVTHLDNYYFEDYLEQVEEELKKDLKKGREIVVIGYSFGGQLAIYLASKYKLKGVCSISAPYPLSFFLSSRPLVMIAKIKKLWRKPLPKEEVEHRQGAFYYDSMPGYTLEFVKNGVDLLKKVLPNVKAPLLLINSKEDIWIPNLSATLLKEGVRSKIKHNILIDHKGHNLFYSSKQDEVYSGIVNFFKKIDV